MKASEIASKNHITIEDLFEVCKDLGIDCDTDSAELSDQEFFLVEKKIEVIKNKKSRQVEKKIAGKKIKLKRKVKLSTAVKKKKTTDEKSKKEKPEEKKKKPAEKPVKKKFDRKPGGAAAKKETKPAEGTRKVKDKSAKDESPAAGITKSDTSKKKKKIKDKEKEKKYSKEKYSEKSFSIKKKQHIAQKKEATTPEEITVIEGVTVGELAKKLNVKANDLISRLMKLGEMATINQTLDIDTVVILADEFGTEVKIVSLFDETVIKQEEASNPEDIIDAPPVVTVMGHVDHGKTKLLDAIRLTNVTEHEHGGITQHIGAYMVKVNSKKITFLDTPGHSAFTTMRARGAGVTDIVILVVAANDGVMPQTIEAIDHAKEANVPIIVAINKVDLEDANPAKVKQELSNYELIPEEWGGQTLFAEISAKQKINIENLLDLILIQTEMLELKANPKQRARGTVLESTLDVGRGAVTTILIQNGTLKVGDPFVVGVYNGKVRAMFNDQGEQIKEAGPSTPVEVLGISGVPEAGDPFEGVESDKFAKQISQKRLEYKRIESAKKIKKVTLESLNDLIRDGEIQDLRIIVKADVDGSAQALTTELEDLSNDDVRVKVIHHGTGGINESDVMLATASKAIIIGFHVRATGKVADLAEKENVSLKYYNIIFEATDDIKAAMKGMLKPVIKEEIQGTGEIRQVFKISKIGTAGGSVLESGTFTRKSRVRLMRDGVVIYEGELKSLKRYKDDVKDVQAGQEFGFVLEGFNDLKEGDSFEAYILKEIARESAE